MHNKLTKKILFVGMPDTAYLTLKRVVETGVNVAGVVPPHPSNPTHTSFVQYAKGLGLEVVKYEDRLDEPDFISKIKLLEPDLAVVTSYDRLFPKVFLECAKDGFVNAHPSLLPNYRGANPYSHVIMNAEHKTGVTLHFMDETFDTGDIIAQKMFEIQKNDTMGILFSKLNFLTAQMLVEMLETYERDPILPRLKQPFGQFVKAPVIPQNSDKTKIDWGRSADYLYDFVRALNPFIVAMTSFKGNFLKVFSAETGQAYLRALPGEVVGLDETIDVATADGILKIKTLQYGTFMVCDAKEFIDRVDIKIGDRFE